MAFSLLQSGLVIRNSLETASVHRWNKICSLYINISIYYRSLKMTYVLDIGLEARVEWLDMSYIGVPHVGFVHVVGSRFGVMISLRWSRASLFLRWSIFFCSWIMAYPIAVDLKCSYMC